MPLSAYTLTEARTAPGAYAKRTRTRSACADAGNGRAGEAHGDRGHDTARRAGAEGRTSHAGAARGGDDGDDPDARDGSVGSHLASSFTRASTGAEDYPSLGKCAERAGRLRPRASGSTPLVSTRRSLNDRRASGSVRKGEGVGVRSMSVRQMRESFAFQYPQLMV